MTPRKRPARKKTSAKKAAARKKAVKKSKVARRPAKPRKTLARKKAVKKTSARKSAKKSPARKLVKRTQAKAQKKHALPKKSRTQRKAPTRAKKSQETGQAPPKKRPAKKSKKPARKSVPILVGLAKETPKPEKTKYPIVSWAENARIDMLVPLLKDLAKNKIISDWTINALHARSANVYVGSAFAIEDQLAAIREDVIVTIYRRFPDGTMGETDIPVITRNEKEARTQIVDAAAICEHARRKAYSLPEPESGIVFPEGHDDAMLEQFKQGKGLDVALAICEEVTDILSTVKTVKTNCFEILTTAAAVRTMNSNGVDVSYYKTSVYVEVTISAEHEKEEQEFQWRTTVVSPAQLDLRNDLERQVETARDAAAAGPCPGFKGDVLLSGQSVVDFFTPDDNHNPVVLHTFARLAMMGLSQFSLGESLGEFQGEPFSISSNPSLPLGLLTAPVDEEGTPLKPVELIRTGVFASHVATSRYAEHMDVPRTGELSNVHVGHGATREEHLRGNNYVEIASFSWFNPDPFSGDFSAEIRLGYHWVWGKKTPFRGGNFRGNVFAGLLHARFSKEVMQAGRYYGPRAVLFKDAHVTGRQRT